MLFKTGELQVWKLSLQMELNSDGKLDGSARKPITGIWLGSLDTNWPLIFFVGHEVTREVPEWTASLYEANSSRQITCLLNLRKLISG